MEGQHFKAGAEPNAMTGEEPIDRADCTSAWRWQRPGFGRPSRDLRVAIRREVRRAIG